MGAIADLLHAAGVRAKSTGKHTRRGWIQLDCPKCKGELYLGFNQTGNYFNCWRCGRMQLLDTLISVTGMRASELRPLIADSSPFAARQTRPKGSLRLPTGVGPLTRAHRVYLRSRGMEPEELERLWGLQGLGAIARSPTGGSLAWRLFIPILSEDQVVSWTTRSICPSASQRYISASLAHEAFPHKELLYGEDYCRHSVVICEGPADVWRIGPGAVATFGVGISEAQIVRMSRYLVRAVCFDNEPRAQERAEKLTDKLCLLPGETYNIVLDGKDAAEAPRKQIKWLRSHVLKVV